MKALDHFLQRYDEWVTLATKITRDEDNAREVVHVVLDKLIGNTNLENIIEAKKERKYMSTAIYTAYFGNRGAYRRQQPKSQELKDWDEAQGIDPIVLYREQIDIYVKRLPRIEQELFRAHYEDGIPIKEISRCLGMGLSTCHRKIFNAKTTVQNAIIESCSVC